MAGGIDRVIGAETWAHALDQLSLNERPPIKAKPAGDEQKADGKRDSAYCGPTLSLDLPPDTTFLDLPRGTHVNDEVGKRLAKFTKLGTLKVTSMPNLDLSGLKQIPNIKKLIFRTENDHVRSEGVPDEGQKADVCLRNFPDVVKYCPQLESLDIGRNHMLGTDLGSEEDLFDEQEKLLCTIPGGGRDSITKALVAGILEKDGSVSGVSCNGTDPVVKAIAQLHNLRELSLHEFSCWAYEFNARSISALATLIKLRSFSLFEMMRPETVDSPAAIEQVIRQFPQLETFQFELPVVADDKPMEAVYKMLPTLQNLTSLLIQEPTLHPKLLRDLPCCKKLTHLTITHATAKESVNENLLRTIEVLSMQGLKSLTVQYLKGCDKSLVEKQIKNLSSHPELQVVCRDQEEIPTVLYKTDLECVIM
jgi:hypothetical protein